jgi:nucleotide-binding universal stress UspA family protein
MRRCCVVASLPETWSSVVAKKILCAVDGTDQAAHAVAFAAELARATGAELTLLAVNELMSGYGRKGDVATHVWDEAELKGILDNGAAAAKKAGAAAPKTVGATSRDAARAIVMFAEDEGMDHIVVGTGGKGGVKRLILGSVSRDVVFRAHCPVTVVR